MVKLMQQLAMAEEFGFQDIVVPITEAKQLLEERQEYYALLKALAGTENITKGTEVPE